MITLPSPSEKDFRQYSEEIVRDFLQTIMVVDDRAYFEEKESTAVPTEVTAPGPPSFTGGPLARDATQSAVDRNAAFPDETKVISEPVEKKSLVDKAHELNAKKLIEDFAIKGMLCAVIRPKDVEVESLPDKVYPLAENCDIVVFDWVLYGATDGGKVKELISEITKRSSNMAKRLRLIVVYTGQEELAAITSEIKSALEKAGQSNVSAKNDYTLEAGPVRIAVYAKGYVPVVAENKELAARVIPIEQMPDRLIAEFTDMTMGLVSNVAISSMAALRSNTHRILSKFHPRLDAPFLAHRAMLPHPEDANELLVYLIGSELTAVLEGHEVGRAADLYDGFDVIKAWVEMNESEMTTTKERGFAKKFSLANSPDFIGDLIRLLREGFKPKSLPKQFAPMSDEPHKGKLTRKLTRSESPPTTMEEEANALEYEFAALTTLKSNYREKAPILLPGTILKESGDCDEAGGKSKYWVCIQPSCDCVRIEEPRSFLFLKLALDNGRFHLVLRDNSEYKKLRVVYRQYESRSIEFLPADDGSQTVRGLKEDTAIHFVAGDSTRYLWMGELKFEQAQRIINRYATIQSRVGLDESEWLRRWGVGRDDED
jgi:hypothetical protein